MEKALKDARSKMIFLKGITPQDDQERVDRVLDNVLTDFLRVVQNWPWYKRLRFCIALQFKRAVDREKSWTRIITLLSSICEVVGYLWLVLAGSIIVLGILGTWLSEGLSGVQELLSPFNIANAFLTIVTLAPGYGFLMLSKKLQHKIKK